MELKDVDVEEIKKKPVFTEIVTADGKPCNGQFMVQGYLLDFTDGLLCNDTWTDGTLFPAIQATGYSEYRDKGVLTNPDNWRAARVLSGFGKREFWENGTFIREEEIKIS